MHSRLIRSSHAPLRSARSLCLRANRGCAMGLLQAANKWPGRP
jgi:hypothetical protein